MNIFEIAVECLKMFGISNRFIKRYALSSSVVCEICVICS